MHQIYKTEGSFNIEYQLPKIIYSSLISTVLNNFLKLLALSNSGIIDLKENKSKKDIDIRKNNLEKNLKIKFICFLFSGLFYYYFFGIIQQCFALYIKILKSIY